MVRSFSTLSGVPCSPSCWAGIGNKNLQVEKGKGICIGVGRLLFKLAHHPRESPKRMQGGMGNGVPVPSSSGQARELVPSFLPSLPVFR